MKQALTAALVSFVLSTGLSAQTRVRAPANKYTPAQDVQLGRKAEAQVRQQLPVLNDAQVTAYVASIGRRLLAGVPSNLRHREFRYTFHVVNARDINAFALPGGPMYVNRGMLEAATTEGQVAGVMAHELSHVLLRHGTANATKAQGFQFGALAGAIAGAVVGGGLGGQRRSSGGHRLILCGYAPPETCPKVSAARRRQRPRKPRPPPAPATACSSRCAARRRR